MRGKVVLVPFPFDDLRATKVRPAVCLTDPVGPHRHVIMAFISSRTPAELLETDLIPNSRAGRLRHDRVTCDVYAPAAQSDDGHDCAGSAGWGDCRPEYRMKLRTGCGDCLVWHENDHQSTIRR